MSRSADAKRAAVYVAIVVGIVLVSQIVLNFSFGGSPVYVVVSGSMTPTLKIGDVVVAQSVPFSSVKVGDVIIYATPTGENSAGQTCSDFIVVHRVVGFAANGGLITQGDNRVTNPGPDEPNEWAYVQANCLRGLVVMAIPYLGIISMLFPPPINYVLVAIVLVLVFLNELRGRGKEPEVKGTQPPTPSS